MLRIDGIALKPEEPEAALLARCAEILRLPAGEIESLRVVRRSVDARR